LRPSAVAPAAAAADYPSRLFVARHAFPAAGFDIAAFGLSFPPGLLAIADEVIE